MGRIDVQYFSICKSPAGYSSNWEREMASTLQLMGIKIAATSGHSTCLKVNGGICGGGDSLIACHVTVYFIRRD